MNPIQQAIEQVTAARDWLPTICGELSGLDVPEDGANMRAALTGLERVEGCIDEALTSLRSLQKEVEGVLPGPAFRLKWRNGMYWVDKPSIGDTDVYTADQLRTAVAAALGRGAVAQGLKLIGYSCDEGGCGRIHETQDGDGDYMQPVYVLAAPSPEATQPTQAEAPSEREAREMQEVADKLREAGYHSAANNTERTIADIKSGNMPRAVIGAALATQQAVQAEPVNSVDFLQRRGYLGEPNEWREACRLFRVRCSEHDIAEMAKLRTYIEEGLLEVKRPVTPHAPGQVERINLSTFAWGVTRMGDNPKAVLVSFRSEPTDDDLRALHEALRPASGRTVHANAAQAGQVERDREDGK